MEDAYNNLFTKRAHLTERTKGIYKTNIEKCCRNNDCFSVHDICEKSAEIVEWLDTCSPNTAKLCATSVIALLRENDCANETILPFVDKYQTLNEGLKAQAEQQESAGDFASLDEVKHVEKLLTRRVKDLKLYQRNIDRHEDLDLLMSLLLVRLHLHIPFRNELATLRVTSKKSVTTTGNWYLTRPHTIILNDYKTCKRYGRKEYSIPASISRLASRVIKHAECKSLLYLPRHPEKPLEPGYYNTYLSRIFQNTINKNIGSSAIRKAHVTDLYARAPTIHQKKELADRMNHSKETAELFYYKPNA